MRARPSLVLRIALVLGMLAAVGACTSSPGVSGAPAETQAASTQSKAPSAQPTKTPKVTAEPTEAPSEEPTEAPSEEPTEAPSEAPSEEPTEAPTQGDNSPLVQAFVDKMTDPNFQFSGTISGAMTMTYQGQEVEATLSGSMKVKGQDSSMSLTITVLGQKTTTEAVVVGDYAYSRAGSGTWSKTARPTTSGGSITDLFSKIGGLQDKGVATWKGKQLHKLLPGGNEEIDPAVLGVGNSSTMTNLKITLIYWAQANGTPAGMEIDLAGDYAMSGSEVPFTMIMNFSFDKLSGVTITAPI